MNVVEGRKSPKEGKLPKGKARHIRIEIHDNGGGTVHSEHEAPAPAHRKRGGKTSMGMGMMLPPPMESHSASFDDMDKLKDHVASMLPGAPAAGDGQATPSGAPEPPAGGDEEEEENEPEPPAE